MDGRWCTWHLQIRASNDDKADWTTTTVCPRVKMQMDLDPLNFPSKIFIVSVEFCECISEKYKAYDVYFIFVSTDS